ncbi:hypothetical protein FANTH_11613 [Fusarium anthophilum]|uniref:NACHT domain-containing protein n=1 Tax=Fusarium anthophilum TaxID=48485 RepID=A0A8H4YWW4_9HYPO|nr:hypothetical protein FANTH_11613 [Fusarium anthophilum]
MLTGFEALGAASAVLQVVSFATSITAACKEAYDGATTSDDDLHRHAKQMSEAIDRLKSRCGQMTNTNASFRNPELNTISQDCSDAAKELEKQVSYVTSLQARGDIGKAFRKAFRTFRRKKKLEDLERSLSRYKQLIDIELKSHLCSRNEAVRLQQESAFQKLDTDVQSLVNQLAQGLTDVKVLFQQEHSKTRTAITQETARAEVAINSHTDSQLLEMMATAETKKKCEIFLQSLKAPRMNQRYTDIMDSEDASFKQVFATYEEMIDIYYGDLDGNGHPTDNSDPENDDNSQDEVDSGDHDGPQDGNDLEDDDTDDDTGGIDSEGYEFSEASSDPAYMSDMDNIHDSWFSFNSWLKSDDKLFYILGKPGSGKSTLVKFVLNQDQTKDLIKEWSSNAIILSHFFWKIGSEEQNSIKGLWCSLLYKRLKDQQHLISTILEHFSHLSLHSEYHDWSIKDLQDVWTCVASLDPRPICVFVDGLDEIRNEDGFTQLVQAIQSISRIPRTKLCVSTRPEAQIMRWIKSTKAAGILLEELTRFDMLVFVQQRFCQVSSSSRLCQGCYERLSQELVDKAEGVFLWLYLATSSIIDGIENQDTEDMITARLDGLPVGLEKLYIEMWERLNAKSTVYRELARRYFRYILHGSMHEIEIELGLRRIGFFFPLILEIACAEDLEIQERLLIHRGAIGAAEIVRICHETMASMNIRCAGLLETGPLESSNFSYYELELLGHNATAFCEAFGGVKFIHRTAHDFLTDTEAGQGILGREPLSDYPSQARLLKGAICMVIVVAAEWNVPCRSDDIIEQITDFATRWGREGLQLAVEMLNIVRPIFDEHLVMSEKNFYTFGLCRTMPRRPFLSYLISDSLYDDYVISCLKDGCSASMATRIMREGWRPESNVKLPKRAFDALIVLGADPHIYGVCGDSPRGMPFVREGTAFTNLLMSFLVSPKTGIESEETQSFGNRSNEPMTKPACEILAMALYMAKTCQNLNAEVAVFASSSGAERMKTMTIQQWMREFKRLACQSNFVVYEVNLQFLLLYLISNIGGNLAEGVLASLQARDVLLKFNNPSVKVRYFRGPDLTSNRLEQDVSSPLILQRTLTQTPSLSRRDIEHLFDTELGGHSQVSFMSHEVQTQLETLNQCLRNLKVEAVHVEDMMTTLAAGNLGICTYEKTGILEPSDDIRRENWRPGTLWNLFPSARGQLAAAAEAIE